jgi:hypothetical protein
MAEHRDGGLRAHTGRISPVAVAAGAGALWGTFGYGVLWESAPFGVNRRFVVSAAGTLLLLPVRIVLWGIHFVEEHVAGHPFSFVDNTWWIGAIAGAVGAALCVLVVLTARWVIARLRKAR